MSTIVGTNIEVTNIKFDSDTTSMIISNTGQITAQGEGTATTNLQQGLAKAWVNFNGTSTIQTRDSFNTASLTDGGSGNYDINWTNSFANTNYCHSGADGNYGQCNTEPQSLSTGEANVYSYNASHALTDIAGVATVTHGDLA